MLNLGIEKIKPIFNRGVLIDLAGYKNVITLPENYETSLSNVKNTLTRQGIKETDPEPGDALVFNLGRFNYFSISGFKIVPQQGLYFPIGL